jgi:glutathione S-transferase
MRADLESRFSDLERYLNKYDGKYFVDDTPRAAEFACFHHLDLSKKLDPKLLDGFPRLMKFVDDIQSIDEVSKYMEKRPELIDVGIEPKLVIDGIAHLTGVNRT